MMKKIIILILAIGLHNAYGGRKQTAVELEPPPTTVLKNGNYNSKENLLFDEWVFAVRKYAGEVLRQDKLSSYEYFNLGVWQDIHGAPSKPGRVYKKEFTERGGWSGIFGRADNKVYKDEEWRFLTLEEWIEQVTAYNENAVEIKKINSVSYKRKKLYLMIPGAPSLPEDVYGEKFIERGGWSGIFGTENKVYKDEEWRFLTLEEWIEQVNSYNENAIESRKINSSTYSKKKLYLRIPGAPGNPYTHYKEEFIKKGGWSGIFSHCRSRF